MAKINIYTDDTSVPYYIRTKAHKHLLEISRTANKER